MDRGISPHSSLGWIPRSPAGGGLSIARILAPGMAGLLSDRAAVCVERLEMQKERPPTEVGGGGREKGSLRGVLRLNSPPICTRLEALQILQTDFPEHLELCRCVPAEAPQMANNSAIGGTADGGDGRSEGSSGIAACATASVIGRKQ